MTWSEQHALCSTLPGHPTTTRGAGESQNLIDFPPGYTMQRQIRDMPLLLHALKQQLWELSFTWLLKLPRLLFYNSVLLDSLHTTTHSKDTKLQNSNPCSKTQGCGYFGFLHSYLFHVYCLWVESSNFCSVWSNQTMKSHLTITGSCTCLCHWYDLWFIAALEN